MRRLGADKSRIQVLSLPEMGEFVRDLTRMIRKGGKEFRVSGRSPRESHVVNAVLVHFLGMTDQEQRAAFLEGKARLEALMAFDEEPPPEVVARIVAGAKKPAEREAGEVDPSRPEKRNLPGGGSRGRKPSRENGDRDVV